jgi:hypothetical protein
MDTCLVTSYLTNEWGVMMHWKATGRKDHEALRRLAVVLLTLAAITESIARHSAPVRCLVLWLFSRAETRARVLAFRMGAGAALAFPSKASPVFRLGGAGEAARLAASFRALAAGFFALSRLAARGVLATRKNGSVRLFANYRTVMRRSDRSGPLHRSFIDSS